MKLWNLLRHLMTRKRRYRERIAALEAQVEEQEKYKLELWRRNIVEIIRDQDGCYCVCFPPSRDLEYVQQCIAEGLAAMDERAARHG